MKSLINSLLMIAAAAGIGLAVGFALRKSHVSETAELPAVVSASPAGARPSRVLNRPTGVHLIDDSPLATQLERDLSMSSGVTRWLYWLEALEKAAPNDFPRLARLAQGNSTAMPFVAARWVEVAPRHFFDSMAAAMKSGRGLPADELTTVLFAEWPKRDPEAAIAALNEVGNLGPRGHWRMQVATAVFDQNVERGLRLMSEWHIENYGPRMTAVAKWAVADPRHAAEFTSENPAGYVSQLTMETLGKEWARIDPAGALPFAVSKPGELDSTLATAVLKEWAGRNLNEATDWLAGADDRTRSRLSPAFVQVWAKQDAASALTWCEENLTGSSLAQAVGGVLTGAAEKNVAGAAELVAAMSPSPARAEAAVAVARKWLPELSSAKSVAPETVAWLASLDVDSVKRVLDQAAWRWATSDPKTMAAFVANASSEQIPSQAYSVLARELARRNPSDPLEWASLLPEERCLSAGSEAFAEWRRSQPESAMRWLNDLPSSDPRRELFFQDAIRSIAYEPQATEQLTALTAAERTIARGVITKMNLPEDRRTKLLDALKPR